MAKGTWFAKGEAGIQKTKQLAEETKARREAQGPRRLWVEANSKKSVTFLDNPEFFLFEHSLKLGQKFRNHFTCIQEIDTCPICEGGNNPSWVLVASVINHTSYTTKDGKTFKNQKELVVFKSKAREKIIRQIEKRGSLRFTLWEFIRGGSDTECATGEDFEYKGTWGKHDKLTPERLKAMVPEKENPKEWLKPFNYEEIFAPKTADELRKFVGGAKPVGAKDDLADIESMDGGGDVDSLFDEDKKGNVDPDATSDPDDIFNEDGPTKKEESGKSDKGKGKGKGKGKAATPDPDDVALDDLI